MNSVKISFGQMEQTTRKAARGVGLAWGLADEVGKALRRLHENDFNGADALAALFTARAANNYADYAQRAPSSTIGTWHAGGGELDPLICGATLSDCRARLTDAPIEMSAVAHPLLVAGFIGGNDAPVMLQWNDVQLICWRDEIKVTGNLAALECGTDNSADLICRITPKQNFQAAPTPNKTNRATVPLNTWQTLNDLAARTYVPATEASRIKGAGAGLQDND